jgi:hypothetical protein
MIAMDIRRAMRHQSSVTCTYQHQETTSQNDHNDGQTELTTLSDSPYGMFPPGFGGKYRGQSDSGVSPQLSMDRLSLNAFPNTLACMMPNSCSIREKQ